LHQNYDSSYDSGLAALVDDLTKAGNTGLNQFAHRQRLVGTKGLPIQAAFEATLTNHYHAQIVPLDFVADPEGARSK